VLILDLRGLDFVDSAGMSRILAARRRARRCGRRMVLVRGSRAVQRFLQLAALTEHFEYVTKPEDALPSRAPRELSKVAAAAPAPAAPER
jgi:anti-anti-sigma factor